MKTGYKVVRRRRTIKAHEQYQAAVALRLDAEAAAYADVRAMYPNGINADNAKDYMAYQAERIAARYAEYGATPR